MISVIASLIVGCISTYFYLKNNPITWKWTTKTVSSPFYQPTDCSGFKKCSDSKIDIEAEYQKQLMIIIARDACKEGRRTMQIDCLPKSTKHILQPLLIGSGGWNSTEKKIQWGYGAGLLYSRTWGPVGLSIGPGVIKRGKDFDIFILGGALIKF